MNTFPTSRLAAVLAALCISLAAAQPAAAATTPAWWLAFGDASLNLLQTMAYDSGRTREQQLALETAVAQSYVEARIHAIRMITAQALRDAAMRELALLREKEPADRDAMQRVMAVAEEASQRLEQLGMERDACLARLAGLLRSGARADWLAASLAPALADARLPIPAFELPQDVPSLVLLRRADVSAAQAELARDGRGSDSEQLRFVRYLQSIAGTIAAERPRPATQGADATPEAVLDHARREVAQRLWALRDNLRTAEEARAEVDRLGAAYRSARAQQAAGKASETQALLALARLLVQEDRLTTASGALAHAWIAFQSSTGGIGPSMPADLLDGARAPQD